MDNTKALIEYVAAIVQTSQSTRHFEILNFQDPNTAGACYVLDIKIICHKCTDSFTFNIKVKDGDLVAIWNSSEDHITLADPNADIETAVTRWIGWPCDRCYWKET